jgi:hypothetical protein
MELAVFINLSIFGKIIKFKELKLKLSILIIEIHLNNMIRIYYQIVDLKK